MAEIRAFRAFRYDLGRVGSLADVVAPPYDVIDPPLQKALYDRSPYNVIRLILNKEEPGDNETANRYTRAARFLCDWQDEGIIKQDSVRSLYVYHQDFEVEGRRHTRRGFMARVRLEPLGRGRIFAHEETFPGPKADRLRLFHATGMNLSQIFGLYPDENGALQAQLDDAVGRAPPLEATDHLGVVHRLWPVTSQQVVSAVTGAMGPRPIFIADGHHRYETALRYLEDRRQLGEAGDAESAPNFVLMMLVSMSDPGLAILPTHRLVSGLAGLDAAKLRALLEGHFQMETVGQGEKGAHDAWELMEADGGQNLLGLGTASDGVWQIGRLRASGLATEMAPEHSESWRSLGVSILHVLVLGKLIPAGVGGPPECRYLHLTSEAAGEVAARQCELAVLVPPASMTHVEQIAGNLEKMPQKSTYFYPKLLSGLVFNSLRSQ